MNFFKKVWTSIKDFEKYEELASENISKSIIYMLILTIIFSAIISLTYTYEFYETMQNVKTYISDNIDELKIEDGVLTVISSESPIIVESEDNAIPVLIVDTSSDANEEEYIERAELYDMGVILLSDKIVIVSSMLTENQELSYSSYFSDNIESKDEFLDIISTGNLASAYMLFTITIFMYLFIVYFASHLVDAVMLAVLGYLFARIVKLRLKFKATFSIGIYSLTLPIILNLIYSIVNLFTGFTISYFQWMYTTISYIYVAVAILMIKAEIINQKIQLIQLEKIQEKVANEEDESDKSNEEEKKETNEEQKKDKNEDKKDEEGKAEPEGLA